MNRAAPLDALTAPLTGTMLVEASAGTGKTHTITTLFVRLVVERGLTVRQVLVVTFTEAATAELRDRIRRRLRAALDALSGIATPNDPELALIAKRVFDAKQGDVARTRAQTALRELDLAAISTIHAFAMRALQEHAFESGARFGLELMPDPSPLVREVADDYWASRVYDLDRSMYLLRDKDFELGTARKIVTTFSKRGADVPVCPSGVLPDLDELRAQVAEAYGRARALWEGEGANVRALLESSPALNRSKVSLSTLARCFDALNAYFDEGLAESEPPRDALKRLSTSALAIGTKAKQTPPAHPFFDAVATLALLLTALTKSFILGLRRGAVDYVRRELPKRKEALRVRSFDDLLHALDAAVSGNAPRAEALRERITSQFHVALIDEFQDTDPVQYRIFHSLFADRGGALMLVGDPKQSIYAFRGADVFSYIHAVTSAESAEYTLGENRRSDPSLVQAVNAIFARPREPFMLSEIGFRPVVAHAREDRIALGAGGGGGGKAFEVLFVPRERDDVRDGAHGKGWLEGDLPDLVAREIARFLASGATINGRPVVPGDIAVLTRKNAQARSTQAALRQLQIPTALQSDESVFESGEAADVELLLRAVLEPTRNRTVRAALATTLAGLTANEIVALDSDETSWDRWSETFRGWQSRWDEHGFIHAYRQMLTVFGAEKRLLALVDGERRMTNLLHLGELLHAAAVRERLGRAALVRWLGMMRAEDRTNGELGSEATELRLESDAHAVKLLTIHKSKGLEFPIVYCPFLYDVRLPKAGDVTVAFHDPADAHRLTIDIEPSKDCPALLAATDEYHAENQRLLYVALTRAKHRCSIVWGAINEAECSSLAYTLHQGGSNAGGAPLRAETSERYKSLTDAELKADLADLVAASGNTISVVDLVDADGGPYVAAEPAPVELSARRFARTIDTWFRVGSFTAFTSSGRRGAHGPEEQGRDRDEVEERTGEPAVLSASLPLAASAPVVLHAFPRGTKPGTMLHAILEEHDFASNDAAALSTLVAAKLAACGYSNDEWGDVLVSGIRAMLETPLDDTGLTLASVPRSKRVDELEFVFPVAAASTQLTAKALARAFAAHRTEQVPSEYPARVGQLAFVPLRGFLKGYIDLVFEHDGRFYVVDYKSNHLGPNPEDYAPAKLAEAMSHHDYFLQYHLYVVALHRWLGRRMRDYDYDTHFGGVLYLFARGMSPTHPAQTGVFRDRPTRAMVEALSEAGGG